MRLDDLGEFGLIARLASALQSRPDVVTGIGDDAAVLDLGPNALLVATVDAQVAGHHFLLDVATPSEIGHKALAVNLSDIAAMGAEPLWALVSLCVPPALDVAILDGVYAGLGDEARRYGVAVVGGNVSATEGPLVIDVTLLGRSVPGGQITRAGGRPGDLLMVTGPLGAAAAGVLVARSPDAAAGLPPEALARARAAMVAPVPRVEAGRALAASGTVTAMLDLSDGLASDLAHLCERSGVGAEVIAAEVPVDPAAEWVAPAYGRDPLALALSGGEDYELLCAVRPELRDVALAAARATGCAPRIIGRLLDPAAGILVQYPDSSGRPLASGGWDHLRPGGQGEALWPIQ